MFFLRPRSKIDRWVIAHFHCSIVLPVLLTTKPHLREIAAPVVVQRSAYPSPSGNARPSLIIIASVLARSFARIVSLPLRRPIRFWPSVSAKKNRNGLATIRTLSLTWHLFRSARATKQRCATSSCNHPRLPLSRNRDRNISCSSHLHRWERIETNLSRSPRIS